MYTSYTQSYCIHPCTHAPCGGVLVSHALTANSIYTNKHVPCTRYKTVRCNWEAQGKSSNSRSVIQSSTGVVHALNLSYVGPVSRMHAEAQKHRIQFLAFLPFFGLFATGTLADSTCCKARGAGWSSLGGAGMYRGIL